MRVKEIGSYKSRRKHVNYPMKSWEFNTRKLKSSSIMTDEGVLVRDLGVKMTSKGINQSLD